VGDAGRGAACPPAPGRRVGTGLAMSRTLLVPAPHVLYGRLVPYVPLGLLSLQAAAEAAGEDVDILLPRRSWLERDFASAEQLVEALLAAADLERRDLVGLSTVCSDFHHTLRLAERIKQERPDVLVVLGGPHASSLAEAALELPMVDAVVEGEAELTIVELLRRRPRRPADLLGIAGIRIRGHGAVLREPIVDLDRLPDISSASQYRDALEITGGAGGTVAIEAVRGCPGRCRYCSTRQFWGRTVRRKSDSRLLAEMRRVNEAFGGTDFELIGDDFGSPHRRLMSFCAAMDGSPFTWRCDIRLSRLTAGDLDVLWRSGCRGFFVGIESASQTTLDRVRKGVRLDRELDVVQRAVEMGFEVHTSLIVGFPWEGPDDLRATYRLHCRLLSQGVVRSQLFLLCPLPGTCLTREHPVRFDRWSSHIAVDGLPIDDWIEERVRRHPDLFAQLGHFDTPRLDRPSLLAARDAAAQMSALRAARC